MVARGRYDQKIWGRYVRTLAEIFILLFEFLPWLAPSKCATTELIYYEMPFRISLLKHLLWQMAEDWKVKHGILNVMLLNIWKIFLSEKEEERKVNRCRCQSFSFILSWQSILPGKSAKGILILIDCITREDKPPFPINTCTDHLFAAPSGSEQPDGEGSHQHTHPHHLCWAGLMSKVSRGLPETGGVRGEGKLSGFNFDKFRGVPLYKTRNQPWLFIRLTR